MKSMGMEIYILHPSRRKGSLSYKKICMMQISSRECKSHVMHSLDCMPSEELEAHVEIMEILTESMKDSTQGAGRKECREIQCGLWLRRNVYINGSSKAWHATN
mmetsp:Transcript_90876/g.160929  ORF Transcript_90876/g.160929 Transcript_90876/m.160929 type:complete len:104 (+) Transcript_90876:127-438(+)